MVDGSPAVLNLPLANRSDRSPVVDGPTRDARTRAYHWRIGSFVRQWYSSYHWRTGIHVRQCYLPLANVVFWFASEAPVAIALFLLVSGEQQQQASFIDLAYSFNKLLFPPMLVCSVTGRWVYE